VVLEERQRGKVERASWLVGLWWLKLLLCEGRGTGCVVCWLCREILDSW